jgi:hypothetical protein
MKVKLIENLISPSKDPNILSLWHGGNLDFNKDVIVHKGGRWEYGPGLYLTTKYEVVSKYARGSRKLYMVDIMIGTDLKTVSLPLDVVNNFINSRVIKRKKIEVLAGVSRRIKDEALNADTFLNILINNDAIKNSETDILRKFFVANKIDYNIIDNAFGWGEKMIVLFNMKKIDKITVVKPKDRLEMFDLPIDKFPSL